MAYQTLASVLSELTQARSDAGGKPLVHNWREMIPPGSRWEPGFDGKPDCPTCLGTGYVRLNVPVHHALFGKLVACDCASAGQNYEAAKRLLEHSGLSMTVLNMKWGQLVGQLAPAVQAVRDTLKRGWGWVYVWGDPGQGKTHLLITAVADTLRYGKGAAYVTMADMLGHLRSGLFDDDYRQFDKRLDNWRGVEVLAIDEMGGNKETDWTLEAERRVLDRRYQSALFDKNQVTIMASNQPPDVYSQWLTSRILDGRFQVVHLDSADLRRMM